MVFSVGAGDGGGSVGVSGVFVGEQPPVMVKTVMAVNKKDKVCFFMKTLQVENLDGK
jgi:hypothetical protein